jgi:hypothetical protein
VTLGSALLDNVSYNKIFFLPSWCYDDSHTEYLSTLSESQ